MNNQGSPWPLRCVQQCGWLNLGRWEPHHPLRWCQKRQHQSIWVGSPNRNVGALSVELCVTAVEGSSLRSVIFSEGLSQPNILNRGKRWRACLAWLRTLVLLRVDSSSHCGPRQARFVQRWLPHRPSQANPDGSRPRAEQAETPLKTQPSLVHLQSGESASNGQNNATSRIGILPLHPNHGGQLAGENIRVTFCISQGDFNFETGHGRHQHQTTPRLT